MIRFVITFLALAFALPLFGDPAQERDAFKARILALHEAAFHGDREAKKEIKALKSVGEGEESDYVNVFELIAKAEKAKKPDEFTLLDIGHAYNFGLGGLEVDKKQGAHWYARAARAGSKVAIYNLGIGYFRGYEGQRKDWTLAQGLLQAANALTRDGDKNSIWTLAAMAKEEENYDRAFILFTLLGPKEPYGYWEAAQLAESGQVTALKEPQSAALDLYERAGLAGWRRGSAGAGRLYLHSSDPKLRDPAKALQRFVAALADEPPDGSVKTVVENALLGSAASEGDAKKTQPAYTDLSASEGYSQLKSAAARNPELANDWLSFNRSLERYWPAESTP